MSTSFTTSVVAIYSVRSVADKIIIDCKVAFQLIKQSLDDKIIYPSSDFHPSKLFVKSESTKSIIES